MVDSDVQDHLAIASRLRQQAKADQMRVTVHGHQEMVEENIFLHEVREALIDAMVIENYADHKRGPCCLICGQTARGRYLHVVCTTSLDLAIIITVYEPKLPKWPTPFVRGGKV